MKLCVEFQDGEYLQTVMNDSAWVSWYWVSGFLLLVNSSDGLQPLDRLHKQHVNTSQLLMWDSVPVFAAILTMFKARTGRMRATSTWWQELQLLGDEGYDFLSTTAATTSWQGATTTWWKRAATNRGQELQLHSLDEYKHGKKWATATIHDNEVYHNFRKNAT